MGSVDDISQLCRLCLVKDQVNIPIFGESSDIGQTFVKINSCLPVKVSRDDNLPKKICDGCSYKLDMLYIFRNTSVDSEKQLISWLNQAGLSTISQAAKDPLASTKPEIMVKQETFDATDSRGDGDNSDMGVDAQSYILQQQQLPYQQDFEFGEPSGSTVEMTDEPAPKRAKRAAAMKKAPIEETDDVEDDLDAAMQITKAEEEDSEDIDQPDYVETPSADDQPGPSGVGKASVEAPWDHTYTYKQPKLLSSFKKEKGPHFEAVWISNGQPSSRPFIQPKAFQTQRVLYHISQSALTHIAQGKHSKPDKIPLKPSPMALKNQQFLDSINGKKCANCDLINNFSSIKEYFEHEKQDIREARNTMRKCEECGKLFLGNKLKWHLRACHLNKECDVCGKVFKSLAGYNNHKITHEIIKPECDKCGLKLESWDALKDHSCDFKGSKPYKCCTCGELFKCDMTLKKHLLRSHCPEEEQKPYECEICQKRFTTKYSQVAHVRGHTEKFSAICEVCGKTYRSSENLRLHMRIHTGYKPFECTDCGKTFSRKCRLIKHRRVHTGVKSFSCETCGKSFAQKESLDVHRRYHTGETPYECHACQKKFVSKWSLKLHSKRCWETPSKVE